MTTPKSGLGLLASAYKATFGSGLVTDFESVVAVAYQKIDPHRAG
ncbi:hypothetical protein QDX21_04930 [Auritidibacter ignavus]|uniref:Uncharacterized protein n=1 Tax=Auritidibacter ignavus TaxID=678932 RepID=A0AAJ6DFA9_9MICC|nr:hypothetical protein [Auritidibacter ignavus]NIH72251.1 hypothetical protein [Auritidibacter ignavus]WGH94138.1 hypothetical protein QDX21_04930 [Auritidibacter ignavus]